MKILNNGITYFLLASLDWKKYVPLVACRMIKMSVEHGYSSDSAFGLSGYSASVISVMHDIEDGYRWGKIALTLLESFDAREMLPRMKLAFYSFLAFWVEPIQSGTSVQLDNYQDALVVGDIESGMLIVLNCCAQRIMSGFSLYEVDTYCAAFSNKMVCMH